MAHGILVLAEHLRGGVSDITFEMLGLGRRLAEELQAPMTAVLLGENLAPLAGGLGAASKVIMVDNPRLSMSSPATQAAVVQALIDSTQASLVLVGGTNVSMGIGPVLSATTHRPFVNFCKAVRIESGAVVVTSQLFGGKILSEVRLEEARGILSISPGANPADAGRSEKAPEVETREMVVGETPVIFKRFIEPETGDVDVTKQDTLVGVGRGIQSQDNLELAEELAKVLGGAVCASRPVIDQGWLPLSRQVGKSGMSVKPRLYVALGISGAPEHWEGMQNSGLILAINTDPKAPIFDGAHFGICADLLDLMPVLTEKIKARKG